MNSIARLVTSGLLVLMLASLGGCAVGHGSGDLSRLQWDEPPMADDGVNPLDPLGACDDWDRSQHEGLPPKWCLP